MSDSERVYLTLEQAEAMLPEGEKIHTFRGRGAFLQQIARHALDGFSVVHKQAL